MYRQALKLDRKLLVAPVVIAAAVAAWFSFGAAPAYRSTASLWVDNGVSVASSIEAAATAGDVPGSIGPAALESEVVSELLGTPGFATDVANGSDLVKFYADGGSAGGFSPAVLISRLRQRSTPPEERAVSSILAGIQTSVEGPQVLNVSYDGPSPAVARSVVSSLIDALEDAAAKFGPNIGQAAEAYYQKKIKTAMQIASSTRGALNAYLQSHPTAQGTDPAYAALTAEERTAAARLATAKLNTNQANTESRSAISATIAVIDRASLAHGSTTTFSTRVAGIFAGAFAGAILSAAVLMLLAAPIRPWDAEMPLFEGLAWSERRIRSRQATPESATQIVRRWPNGSVGDGGA